MIYLIVRLFIPIYLAVMVIMWFAVISDIAFGKKKNKRIKKRFILSLIWPLSLFHIDGRTELFNSFKGLFNKGRKE